MGVVFYLFLHTAEKWVFLDRFHKAVFVDSAFNHLGTSFLVTEIVTLNHYSL